MQYPNDKNVKDPEKRKKNILISGESGTGKTEIIRRLAKAIDVPIFIADATQYTEEGYVGDSVNNMLLDLLRNANGDKDKAERGILVIDEIDKKADGGDRSDVARGAVLNSLLKIIEGTVKKLTNEKTLPNGIPVKERIDFNTSRLTVICLGAFEDLEKFRDERVKRANKPKVMGFANTSESKEEEVPVNVNFINEDYQAFGMGNQFINRLDNKVYLNRLNKENLIDIMKNSNLSSLELKKEDFRRDGIELEFTEDFYDALGSLAVSKKAGARGINEALEDVFELLGLNDINTRLYSKIVLNGKCIDDPNELIMIERNKVKQKTK
jgi:ATP-dependent Clp protease ATP-binding subunit ClpX